MRFTDDTEHASQEPAWANRYWQVLSQVNLVVKEFAASYAGKGCGPNLTFSIREELTTSTDSLGSAGCDRWLLALPALPAVAAVELTPVKQAN